MSKSLKEISDNDLLEMLMYKVVSFKEFGFDLDYDDLIRCVTIYPISLWYIEDHPLIDEKVYAKSYTLSHHSFKRTKFPKDFNTLEMFKEIYIISGMHFFIMESKTIKKLGLESVAKEAIELAKHQLMITAYEEHCKKYNIVSSDDLLKMWSITYTEKMEVVQELMKIHDYYTYDICANNSDDDEISKLAYSLTDEKLSTEYEKTATNIITKSGLTNWL